MMSNFRKTRSLPVCSYLPVVDNTLCETESRVGKYMLGKLIGKGQFSVIRKCSDMRAGIGNLAMKVLTKDDGDSHSLAHIENEARILFILLANKSHANIIKYYDLLNGQKCVYVVSERLQTDLVGILLFVAILQLTLSAV
jgi:serine/threonine protein kinase